MFVKTPVGELVFSSFENGDFPQRLLAKKASLHDSKFKTDPEQRKSQQGELYFIKF